MFLRGKESYSVSGTFSECSRCVDDKMSSAATNAQQSGGASFIGVYLL